MRVQDGAAAVAARLGFGSVRLPAVPGGQYRTESQSGHDGGAVSSTQRRSRSRIAFSERYAMHDDDGDAAKACGETAPCALRPLRTHAEWWSSVVPVRDHAFHTRVKPSARSFGCHVAAYCEREGASGGGAGCGARDGLAQRAARRRVVGPASSGTGSGWSRLPPGRVRNRSSSWGRRGDRGGGREGSGGRITAMR